MYQCIIVTSRAGDFKEFAGGVAQHGAVEVIWEQSGEKALKHIAGGKTDLVVVDETLRDMTGTEWIRKAVKINPAVNTVAVSSLSAGNFHETTEGLGILFQLPVHPEKYHGEEVLRQLERICLPLRKSDPAAKRESG
jgi:two-component SAPR family response regulator